MTALHDLTRNEVMRSDATIGGANFKLWLNRSCLGFIEFFNSVRLAVVLLSLVALTVLIGAWCPQESAVGQEKVIEQFGGDLALTLTKWGITDIFHTPFFLLLIAFLTVNLTVASCKRVFPKARLYWQTPSFVSADEIGQLPGQEELDLGSSPRSCLAFLESRLAKQGYQVRLGQNNSLVAEKGKLSRLSATITHIGLLTLLVGVTISSWTGFSGFKPVRLGETFAFTDAEHARLWLGRLPTWHVRVNATRRENYETGEAKQWYSNLSVVDGVGRELKRQEISVNNPLTYQSVDIYQSSWGLDQILVAFNGKQRTLDLRPMGKLYASFLPIDSSTILIFSVRDQKQPLRLFAKRQDWQAPRLIAEIEPNKTAHLGSVALKYVRPLPITGLQYKCDPGLPVTYVAFALIVVGVFLAVVPHNLVYASATESGGGTCRLKVAFRATKARTRLAQNLKRLTGKLKEEFPLKEAAYV